MALKHTLFLVLMVAVGVSVVTDLRQRRILDAVTLPALGLLLAIRLGWEGLGGWETGALSGILGAAVAGLLFAGFAAFGQGLGWGDVKLVVVMGAALGMPLALGGCLFVSLAGALQALISLIWQGELSDTVRSVLVRRRRGEGASTPRRHIPYGVAIALGSLWAMWWDSHVLSGS